MRLTVAICTWNRKVLLDQTLAALQGVRVPTGVEWELLVVNNNCTDGTEEVAARHTRSLPLRMVSEPVPGLSNARNTAVREAGGDYIIWTDDDVLVDEGWIEAYAEAFRAHPDAAIFGGPIAPWFEGAPPKWLLNVWPTVADAYAVRDLGSEPFAIGPRTVPFGANYAMRLAEQRRYLYNPLLGRKEKGMLGGEETTLMKAMLADGASGHWVPGAKVRHFIPGERQNLRYLRRYYHGQGLYVTHIAEPATVATLFGYPRWLVKLAVQAELCYLARRAFSPPGVWMQNLIEASTYWGQLQGFAAGERVLGEPEGSGGK